MSLLQGLNHRSAEAMRLLAFFKQIPEFHQLAVEDKIALVRHNLMPLVTIYSTLSSLSRSDQTVAGFSDRPWRCPIFQKVNGAEITMELEKIFEPYLQLARCDQKIVQLALIVLILTKGFSTDSDTPDTILKDGLAVYRAQSVYSELLWKYMEVVHGLPTATHIFHQMISRFIAWQTVSLKIRRNVRETLLAADTDGIPPLMKSLLNLP